MLVVRLFVGITLVVVCALVGVYKSRKFETRAMLRKGYSVRAIAKLENISPTTVQKIKNTESINH